jgi:ribonuclease HI
MWNKKITSYLLEEGFIQSQADPCLFLKIFEDRLAIISCYVDDCLLIGTDEDISSLKKTLTSQFKMKDLGEVKSLIGIQIERNKDQTQIFQTSKIEEMLRQANMSDCHGVETPLPMKIETSQADTKLLENPTKYREVVGSLNYLAVCTRPDISYAVSQISKKMQSPTEGDWILAKRILRYLKKTANARLTYKVMSNILTGYSDASYAPNAEDRKSVSGYVFMLNGAAVSWKSKKQPIVALSSMEAEYIALTSAIKEATWLAKIEKDLKIAPKKMLIYEDNQSTIKTAKNDIYTDRSKHIDVRYHYVREQIQKNAVEVQYCPTGDMTADIMTKALGSVKHVKFMESLGLVI